MRHLDFGCAGDLRYHGAQMRAGAVRRLVSELEFMRLPEGLIRAEELRGRLTSDLLPGFSLDLRRMFATKNR